MTDIEALQRAEQQELDFLTENSTTSNGVFERLMNSVELHIREEYNKKRITGSSYAQTYLGAIQAVLPVATDFATKAGRKTLELEKLRLEIEKAKLEVEKTKADIKLVEAQIELALLQKPLLKYQSLKEQAQTMDVIDNGEECYSGSKSNIHGVLGTTIEASKKQIEVADKNAALAVAEKLVINPFSAIESAEGIGAGYYGLNGGNAIDIINNVRKVFGISELGTEYAGQHKPYMNQYAPDVKLEVDD